jgi:glycosyltransferase involved in cell wall biosynthesis
MSRFPKLTETFVLYEMLALEAEGLHVEIYPLWREKAALIHPEAQTLVERAHYTPHLNLPMLKANLRALRRQPAAYLGALGTLIRANLGSARYLGGGLAAFPKSVYFAERMLQSGVEHVHAHFASHPAAAAFVIHRLTGLPYSFTAHGSDLHRDQHMLREKVAEAAFVVPISNHNRDVIRQISGPESAGRLHVIHCGVDTAQIAPRDSYSLDGPLRLLCIGTLHAVKGQTHLIAALARLRQQGIDARVDFVGDGPDRAALEQQAAEAGLAAFVHFHGPQTREQVLAHLRRADVAVAPSVPTSDGRREGIPVALMEAMAAGLPVVASRLSGIPELITDGETGLLAPPGDVAALVAAIRRLHDDARLRRTLGEAARATVERDFDLRDNAARLAQRFQEERR